MRPLLVLGFTLLAAVRPAIAAAADPFAYDRNAPLDVRDVGQEMRGAVTVRDVTFVGVTNPIKAYLVTPATPGPHAAILFVHWLGDPATTNRTEFLNEAVGLAAHGVVSLLVDAMWSDPKWWDGRKPETDFAGGVRQVIELRRALDLLLAQPGVDAGRLALVGHDFGAMFGIVAGGADRRPKTYVLMTPVPHLSEWYLYNVKPAAPDEYKQELAPLDPVAAVAKLAAVPMFFQFAAHDKYVPAPRQTEFYDAAGPRKQMATYDCDHGLPVREATADRDAWLTRELQLTP